VLLLGPTGAAAVSDAAERPWWRMLRIRALSPRHVAGVAALIAGYVGAAQLSYALDFAGPVAAIVWLPVGVGIAFLYLGGLRLLPGVLIGDLLVNDYGTLPLGAAIGQSLGNVLEVLVAVLIIRRFVRRGTPLDSVGSLTALLLAIAAATAVSATIGTASLALGGVLHDQALEVIWRTWWLGDFAGALVVTPLLLAWYRPLPRMLSGPRLVEAALLGILIVGLTNMASRSHSPSIYLVFPTLIWSALRFGRRGATTAIAVTVAVVVWNTTHYFSQFAYDSLSSSVLRTQVFVAAAAGSTLVLAAMVSERERHLHALAVRARLAEGIQAQRRRLEQDVHDGLQQRLIWLGADLHRLVEALGSAPERVSDMAAKAEDDLGLALDELRRLAHGLHPALLTELGLHGAITGIARRFAIPVAIEQLPPGRFPDTVELTAYYVLAEAIVNAQKHSEASCVRVSVAAKDAGLLVDIADDGIGGADPSGSGLRGLCDRVEAAGGAVRITSRAGHGTQITATIPFLASHP
jgi:signal transduction histidine kinase